MQTTTSTKPEASSTTTVHSDDLGLFRESVSSSFVPLEVTAERDSRFERFSSRLSSIEADGIAFTEVAAMPHVVERTDATIEQGGSGYYKLSLLLAGRSMLVQDGRELVMRPGDLTIYDTSRPYSLIFTERFRNLIVMFPKDRLEVPNAVAQVLTAQRLGEQGGGVASLVTSFLAPIPGQFESFGPGVRARLAHTALDLIGTLVTSIIDASPERQDPHRMLLHQICGYIEAELGSSDLSPGRIAAAHFISTRHLHALFKQADTTVSTWVRERRLERCRADLIDPLLADRAVAAIAARWGFTDPAHFSRVFKAAYGCAPSELRRTECAALEIATGS
ncbi:MAG: helix-turn-helix domain-containing protein [Leucobacter sp.]|nr:helix-turn-helix domain-containing protein [Leucobacter sp.]